MNVFTTDGPVPARDVKPGDMVWSLDESRKTFVPARVWRAERTGHDPILKIRTRARTLRCNAQHRVLVRRRHPAPREGLGGRRAMEWRNEWVEAGEIQPGDYLVALNGLPDGKGTTAPNGRVLTEGFMAFAGLMLGDGTVTRGAVSVARHREAPYMPRYRDVISAEFARSTKGGGLPYELRNTIDEQIATLIKSGLTHQQVADHLGVSRGVVSFRYRGLRSASGPQPVTIREYERCTTFSSRAAADELRELGLSGTAHTKRVPDWVYSLTPDLIAAFLSGYIDSDGAVNTRGWLTFSSCSEALLEDTRHLCMAIGIPVGTVRRYKAAGQCEVGGRTVTRGDMYQLFAFNTRANRKLRPYHPEKFRRIHSSPISRVDGCWSPDYQGNGSEGSRPGEGFHIEGGALQLVKDITVEPAQDVYDLGVEGTHTFIADGVVVHNSWGTALEQQALGWLKFSLLPDWLVPFEQRITKELTPQGIEAKYGTKELTRGDSAARAAWYQVMRSIGAMNNDEIREDEDLPPLPNGQGSDYQQPLNSVVQVPGEGGAGGGANDGSPGGTSAGDTGGGN